MAQTLLRSSLIVSVTTMLSRLLGLVRDMAIAIFLGANGATDVFVIAQKIPNFLRRLFAEGAFSQAFVPVLSEYQAQRSTQDVQSLIDKVAGTLGGILLGLSILGVIGSPVLMLLFGSGFLSDAAKFELASYMLKITFPYLFFISLTAFAGAILNSHGKFAIPSLTPIWLNLCLILACVFGTKYFDEPAVALAWAIFIAGVIQLVFQIPFLIKINRLPRPQWGWRDPGVQRILKLMIPALFGVSVTQINLMVDTTIATFLPDGSVSWLYYSDRLLEFPLGIFGIGIATVIMPSLSRKHATKSHQDFSAMLDWGLRWILLIGLPSAVGLVCLAEPIMLTLFQHGKFSAHDADMASRSLIAFTLGLLGFMLIKVLASGFYARHDTKTPVKIALAALIINFVGNLLLMRPLGHVGLALATSIAAVCNAGLLLQGLLRQGVYRPQAGWRVFSLQLAFALLIMAVVVMLCLQEAGDVWLTTRGLRIAYLIGIVSIGLVVYVASLYATGWRLRMHHHDGD